MLEKNRKGGTGETGELEQNVFSSVLKEWQTCVSCKKMNLRRSRGKYSMEFCNSKGLKGPVCKFWLDVWFLYWLKLNLLVCTITVQ